MNADVEHQVNTMKKDLLAHIKDSIAKLTIGSKKKVATVIDSDVSNLHDIHLDDPKEIEFNV